MCVNALLNKTDAYSEYCHLFLFCTIRMLLLFAKEHPHITFGYRGAKGRIQLKLQITYIYVLKSSDYARIN